MGYRDCLDEVFLAYEYVGDGETTTAKWGKNTLRQRGLAEDRQAVNRPLRLLCKAIGPVLEQILSLATEIYI